MLHNLVIAPQIGDSQRRQAVLLRAEQIAWPAQLKIHLGQLESRRSWRRTPPAERGPARERFAHQHAAEAGVQSASHAAAQLVQLRQAETLGANRSP